MIGTDTAGTPLYPGAAAVSNPGSTIAAHASAAITAGLLYPGGTGTAKLLVTNPNPYPVTVTRVAAGTGAPTGSGGIGHLHADRHFGGQGPDTGHHDGRRWQRDAHPARRGRHGVHCGRQLPGRRVLDPGRRDGGERVSRIGFATGLLAAAWAPAIGGLVAVGDARAEAAWLKSGPGSGFARAGALPAPTAVTLAGTVCNNGNPRTSISWTNPAAGLWTGLEVVATPSSAGTAVTVLGTTTSGTSLSVQLPYRPAYLSVRTVRNSWRGKSPVVVAC